MLRKVVQNVRDPADGKMGPNWEGPYKIASVGGSRSYKLEDMDGNAIIRPWNVMNLKKYYF